MHASAAACPECLTPLGGSPQCLRCGAWRLAPAGGVLGNAIKPSDLIDAADVEASQIERIVTGGPWDPAFGGGVVPGSVTALAGNAGGGKSTLLLQMCHIIAKMTGRPAMYISGEQAAQELRWTLDRIGISLAKGEILLARSMQSSGLVAEETLAARPPSSIIVDSLTEIVGTKAYDAQLALARAYKPVAVRWKVPVFLIVQMAKSGNTLGLNALQHGPDALIEVQTTSDDARKRARILRQFGLDDGDVRILYAIKNRFGACFVEYPLLMTERGFTAIPEAMKRDERSRTGDPVKDEILDLGALKDTIESLKAETKELTAEYEERVLKLEKRAAETPAKVVPLKPKKGKPS